MIRFLIQTIDNKVKHDFSFTLIESINYNNWLFEDSFEYRLTNNKFYSNYVPIGSNEFVQDYIYKYFKKSIKPKNIPEELLDFYFTGRKVLNGTEKDIVSEKFVKSNDKIKSFTNICKSAPIGNYQISDVVEFESEYRCFVYRKELVGVHNYLGDFTIFPNVNKIKEMIIAYKNSPIAYTLDVGICNNDTLIIECHDFFSCGLYGFSNHKILPYMFSNWFFEYINT